MMMKLLRVEHDSGIRDVLLIYVGIPSEVHPELVLVNKIRFCFLWALTLNRLTNFRIGGDVQDGAS